MSTKPKIDHFFFKLLFKNALTTVYAKTNENAYEIMQKNKKIDFLTSKTIIPHGINSLITMITVQFVFAWLLKKKCSLQ